MDSPPVFISYDAFVAKFRPISTGIIEGETGRPMFAAFGHDLQTVRRTDESRVWTVIDVDLGSGEPHPYEGEDGDNCWVIVTGYHYVNRVGYLITEIPWESSDIEVVYWRYRPGPTPSFNTILSNRCAGNRIVRGRGAALTRAHSHIANAHHFPHHAIA